MIKSDVLETKLEIVSKAVETGKLDELNKAGFFKTISQIEKARRINTCDRIWIGRMLKLVFDKSAPNPGGLAIFQKPQQFKTIRKWNKAQKTLQQNM